MGREKYQTLWREAGLEAGCAAAQRDVGTDELDRDVADAAVESVLSRLVGPLVVALEGLDLPPEAQAALAEAKSVL